ncbi:hypothetical protein PbJCM13498_28260 [Prolixibacter bellariivorans]|uniref:Uncharacterized protein n=1 Tax=Prolixibacter bellariivorans TaxID=314319 RepID=A0A5M4B2E4_9BACT|nr:hypothetical protein PbJCM13498_28260 [Prolixibacter bellariivorans]
MAVAKLNMSPIKPTLMYLGGANLYDITKKALGSVKYPGTCPILTSSLISLQAPVNRDICEVRNISLKLNRINKIPINEEI